MLPKTEASHNQLPYCQYIWGVHGSGDETVVMQIVTWCSLVGHYFLEGFFWGGTAAQLGARSPHC
jgi:hypothetical protein